MNASFLNPDVDIDYYFTTDYESRAPWFEKLKEYDFVKFFGQYSTGEYRDKFQVSEKIIREITVEDSSRRLPARIYISI